MRKKEWMILILAVIIVLILLVATLILAIVLKKDDTPSVETEKVTIAEVEEIVYEPIEEDIMVTIVRAFREQYNVIKIMDAHNELEPEIKSLIESGVSGERLKSQIQDMVESYVEGQTRQIARNVLFEYVEGYNSWELDYLVGKANNSEKVEVLYLFEIQHLKSQGVFTE